MFGKKPAPPPAGPSRPAAAQPAAPALPSGWRMQILTTEYAVTGYLQPTDMPLLGWLNVPTQAAVTLSQAQVAALDSPVELSAEARTEVTIPKSAIIGLIPLDDQSLRSASTQMHPRQERAIIYAGPFRVQACFRLAGEMPLRYLFGSAPGDMLVVSDAEICLTRPNSNFPPLKAPVFIISKSKITLYYPA